jgi:rare lipoprotein A (peptidoglycan hydrolase)
MKFLRLTTWIALSVALAHCTGPMAFQQGVTPYTPTQEAWRADQRELARDANQQAYERGVQDGRMDFGNHESRNYRRHQARYDTSTEQPYRDGYEAGYQSTANQTTPSNPTASAEAYNQGVDYGMRDRAAGRRPDPDAWQDRFPPSERANFEQGYYQAFEMR